MHNKSTQPALNRAHYITYFVTNLIHYIAYITYLLRYILMLCYYITLLTLLTYLFYITALHYLLTLPTSLHYFTYLSNITLLLPFPKIFALRAPSQYLYFPKNHSTQDSRVVPHRGTNWAALCLTAQIRRDAVPSESYDRGY